MLPVLAAESRIVSGLRQANRLVLTAPTGSGKTTQVPRILLRAGLVPGQIVILQPRRLATRLVAQRVAREQGQPLGGLVGYQTRHDSQISAATRLRFVTEGLFLRLMQSDPVLTGIGTVILDEFHERSLAADTALGLVRRLQEEQRPELQLVVMSATLDAEAVAAALDCPLVEAHGRAFPVEVEYAPGNPTAPPWERAVAALRLLLSRQSTGDVLVFMPGAYEIRRTIEAGEQALRDFPEPLAFFPLHGSLSAAAQDAAVAPSPRRKVIVATNVAETSITIEGVGHVIDAGLARVHRHDPRRGIDVLLVESTSRASAEQRSGRAGRTMPGTCVRLWSSAEHQARPERDLPEIQRLDLAEAVLHLRALGIDDPLALPWLEPPAAPAVTRATALLTDLGALDAAGHLTDTGRQMALFPAHPRISRLLVEAATRRCLDRAAVWAALIGERDILVYPPTAEFTRIPDDPWPSDLVVRERALQRARELRYDAKTCAAAGIQANACRELERTADLYRAAARRAGLSDQRRGSTEDLLKSLLVAFFDRVALRRGQDTRLCAMTGLRRVELDSRSVARESAALVALEVRELEAGGSGVRTVLSLACAIDPEWLAEVHPSRVQVRTEVVWNAETRAVEYARTREYDGLVIAPQTGGPADPADAAELLVDRIRSGELRLEEWDEQVEQWILRTRFVAGLFPARGLIRYEEDEQAVILHEIVAGATRYSQIRSRPCLPAVQQALSWADRQFVEQMAPTQMRLPNGRRLRIDYGAAGPPRGRARIQDLYDLAETPRIAGGRQPVLLEILGPNHRPVQVTDDLAGFWASTYPAVRQELKRRYPRHEWR